MSYKLSVFMLSSPQQWISNIHTRQSHLLWPARRLACQTRHLTIDRVQPQFATQPSRSRVRSLAQAQGESLIKIGWSAFSTEIPNFCLLYRQLRGNFQTPLRDVFISSHVEDTVTATPDRHPCGVEVIATETSPDFLSYFRIAFLPPHPDIELGNCQV